MVSLGLETVLVSDVGDGVGLAIIGNVVVRSTDNDGGALGAESLQLSLLNLGHSIAGLKTVGGGEKMRSELAHSWQLCQLSPLTRICIHQLRCCRSRT